MKQGLKDLAAKAGVYLASTERFGIDVDLDLKRLTAAEPLKMIFDVGANLGQTAARLVKSFPGAMIHSFEPVPDTFEKLKAATAMWAKVHAHPIGLGDKPGTLPIHIAVSSGSNSLRDVGPGAKTVDVAIDTLDSFCASHAISDIDLLKLDVEGFELPVLHGAKRMLESASIRFIYAECVTARTEELPHTYLTDLYDLLTSHGFCLVSYYAESFHLRLGCGMGNALFAHRKRLPESVPGRVQNIV